MSAKRGTATRAARLRPLVAKRAKSSPTNEQGRAGVDPRESRASTAGLGFGEDLSATEVPVVDDDVSPAAERLEGTEDLDEHELRQTAGGWQVVSACVRGTSHIATDTERQDDLMVAQAGETLVVAVSDGAGSAVHGAAGAATAVRAAMGVLTGTLDAFRYSELPVTEPDWQTLLRAAIATARSAVLELHKETGGHRHDWAATLAIVVAGPAGVWTAKVGDAYVVHWSEEEGAELLAEACDDPSGDASDDGVRYANETVFVTSSTALASITVQHRPLKPADRLLITTDGIAPLLLTRWRPAAVHPPFLAAVASAFDSSQFDGTGLADFLESDQVCARTDDDKTVVLARYLPIDGSGAPHSDAAKSYTEEPGPPRSPDLVDEVGQESLADVEVLAPGPRG